MPTPDLQEVAYLHEPYWQSQSSDWVKSLLLFFDGIALLVPDYMRDRPLLADASLAGPLLDAGLLHRLSPERLVDSGAAAELAELVTSLLEAGIFDQVDRASPLLELSYSRLGASADFGLASVVVDLLRERGLAAHSRDGYSVPLHPAVRSLILVALPQLLRGPAESEGFALQPSAQGTESVAGLLSLLGSPHLPTAGHVVSLDLEQVTLDLSKVPLDEVLDYRQQHGAEHRAYARAVRSLARDLALLPDGERAAALGERREALADAADALRRTAKTAWRRPLGAFSLSIGGAAIATAAHNYPGAAVAAASGLLGLRRQADPESAYSYLFHAQRVLSSP